MSTADVGMRIGRSYTRARRLPWVMGKIGDWTLPFGPYTPAQIGVAFAGAFLLIKTFAWWRVLGPVPVIALAFAVWAVRRAKIGGRTPLNCALGLAAYLTQPRVGRINGRAVREGRAQVLYGGCVIEDVPLPQGDDTLTGAAGRSVRPAQLAARLRQRSAQSRSAVGRRGRLPRKGRRNPPAQTRPLRPAPTAVQQMLRRPEGAGAKNQGDGGVRS
ncbi:hypothetical protein [Streptomyces decoyicus]